METNIEAIFIQSHNNEITNKELFKFIDQLYNKLDNKALPIYLFLDSKSESNSELYMIVNKLNKFKNNYIITIDDTIAFNKISYIFYHMIKYEINKFQRVLLLESDCKLKDNFIEIINKDLKTLENNYLIYGSKYYGTSHENRNHMNGVSVYNRNDIFMNSIEEFFVKMNQINNETNYDFILSEYLIKEKYENLLIDSDYIINLSPITDLNIDYKKIKEKSCIIHQK